MEAGGFIAFAFMEENLLRHGRACPGHPDREGTSLSGMPGTRPSMTQRYVWNGRLATTGRLLLALAARPVIGARDRAAGHHADEVGAVLGAAVDVGVHAGGRDGQALERLRCEA